MEEDIEKKRVQPWAPKTREPFVKRVFGCCDGLLLGVLLPGLVVVLGVLFALANGEFFFSMPTPMHMALAASMPICNFIVWLCISRGWWLNDWKPRFLCGFALTTSIVYAVDCLPVTIWGLMFCCMFFWFFGLGFLGLFPGMFLYASFAGVAIRRRLEELAKAKGHENVRGFGMGMLVGCAAWMLLLVMSLVSMLGLYMAQSKDPAVVARSVKLVRWLGREDAIGGVINKSMFSVFWPAHLVRDAVPREAACEFYYRLSGQDSQYLREGGGNRRRSMWWDNFVGGEKVGGQLEGLSLKGSAYETKVDRNTGIGYAEWTMVFANSRTESWDDLEARVRIALPNGAVVSRLTLWVNGEEQEAAFAGKGAVREAYESVVSRKRDPVLVTMCGPDQVQLQCFPVPPNGEMKVRIGLTVPLTVSKGGRTARFPAPVIYARNFHFDSTMLGLPKSELVQFEQPLPTTASFVGKDGFAVVQKIAVEQGWSPKKVVVVLDTSVSMKPQMNAVKEALSALPADVALELWVADDLAPSAPALESPAGDAARADKLGKMLTPSLCAGGRDNVRMLCKALEGTAKTREPVALVWIHGPEPVELSDGSVLPQYVRKAGDLRFYDCQVACGECPTGEKLLGCVGKVRALAAEALDQDAVAAVKSIGAEWSDQCRRVVRSRVKRDEVPSECAKGDEHLARLWAYGEVLKLYREGDPKKSEQCKEMALPWHIVTPVTGAVVLENREQFKANGLEPVSSSSVPTVPEPSSVLCFILVALTLALTWWFKLRKRNGAA